MATPAYRPGTAVTYTDTHPVTRTGVVWSTGPTARTLWVLPDHDRTNAVLVEVPTAKQGGKPYRIANSATPAKQQHVPKQHDGQLSLFDDTVNEGLV